VECYDPTATAEDAAEIRTGDSERVWEILSGMMTRWSNVNMRWTRWNKEEVHTECISTYSICESNFANIQTGGCVAYVS
jgi:hypothetical protein